MSITQNASRVMQLTAIFLLCGCLSLSAAVSGQQVSLKTTDASLSTVLRELEKQSGKQFVYFDQDIALAHKVSVDLKRTTLEQALAIIFKNQPLTYSVYEKNVVIKRSATSGAVVAPAEVGPPPTVHGRITNEKGEAVAGVSIAIKGGKVVGVTDSNGEFTLNNIADNAVLVFRAVNMETLEVKLNGRAELALKSKTKVSQLADVEIVANTGYQTLPRERATGSFDVIDQKKFNEQVSPSVLSRLPSIANSLQAFSSRVYNGNGDQGLLIRGLSTTTLTIAKPLIILDNFQYEGDLNNINPNDVESVTLLKDAAAASIWGAKAANGVIVITSKKARLNQKLRIDVSSNVTVGQKADLQLIPEMRTSDFIDVETWLYGKGFYASQFSNTNQPPLSTVVETLRARSLGQISSADSASRIDALRNIDVRNDFSKYMYRASVNQQYSLGIQLGKDNFAWKLFTGFDRDISQLSSDYQRINVGMAQTWKILQKLELSSSVYYTQSGSFSGKPGYGAVSSTIGSIPPYTQLADPATGAALPVYANYRKPYLDTAGGGKLLDWRYYPLTDWQHAGSRAITTDLNAVLGIAYRFTPWLNLDVKYRYERQTVDTRTFFDASSFTARNLVNNFSSLNRTTGVVTYVIPKGGILDQGNTTLSSQDLRGQLNLDKSWKRHNVTAIAGAQISDKTVTGNTYRFYGYKDDILSQVPVDFVNSYPTYVNGSSGFVPDPADVSRINTRFVSFYANGAYTYNSKYSFSASMRRDASNLFGVNTNDKWKPLWSVGGSWDITREPFFRLGALPYLRLRGTYGYQGNVDPSKVGLTTFAYSGTNPYTLTPYAQVRNFANPDLRWEQTAILNIGVDFRLKGNRISGSVEYFHKSMSDLYGSAPVDATAGLGSTTIIKNVGSMRGHGWDIALNSVNTTGAVRWTTNLILNTYTDKLTDGFDPASTSPSFAAGGGAIGLKGYPLFSLFAYRSAGLDPATGDPRGYLNGTVSKDYNAIINNTGINASDVRYVGSLLPKVFGSIGNTFSWKGWNLTLRVSYKFGYYFKRESINYNSLFNNYQGHADYALRWQKPGDETSTVVPSLVYTDNPQFGARAIFYSNSDVLTEKGDHICLEYINLGYDLPRIRGFQSLRVFAVASNMGVLWRANKSELDPDYPERSVRLLANYSIGLQAGL